MIKTFHSTFALVAAALLSSPMTVNAVSSVDAFDRGNIEGKQNAEHIWSKDWSDCSNISKFENQVNSYIQKHYSDYNKYDYDVILVVIRVVFTFV